MGQASLRFKSGFDPPAAGQLADLKISERQLKTDFGNWNESAMRFESDPLVGEVHEAIRK